MRSSKPGADRANVPRQTVLETKRSILKKLTLRIHNDCFAS